jgi:hypothetical protein
VEGNSQQNTETARFKVWFFAGGEAGDEKYNAYTSSYMRLMDSILGKDFEFVKGIHYKSPFMNVSWALNNAQRPIKDPLKNRFMVNALKQLNSDEGGENTRTIITSSSTGSIVAAQAACLLAEVRSRENHNSGTFDLALATSIISPGSELFARLLEYQEKGIIGKFIHRELQDQGDNTDGSGGLTRAEAWKNALGILIPALSSKYSGPSFLNTHPVNGHIHRIRSQSLTKATDHVEVLLVKHSLAGALYREKAVKLLEAEKC